MKNLALIILAAISICIVSTLAQPTGVANENETNQKESYKDFIDKCEAIVKKVPMPPTLGNALGGLHDLNPAGRHLGIIEFVLTKHSDFNLNAGILDKDEEEHFVETCAKFVAKFAPKEGEKDPVCNIDPYLEDQNSNKAFFKEAKQHPIFDTYMGIALLCTKY